MLEKIFYMKQWLFYVGTSYSRATVGWLEKEEMS